MIDMEKLSITEREHAVMDILGATNMSEQKRTALEEVVKHHHVALSLEEKESGGTVLVQFRIKTGTAPQIHLTIRQMLLAVGQEASQKLCSMHEIIVPYNSSWTSPVMLVWKNNGLKPVLCRLQRIQWWDTVTQAQMYMYPLPRIDKSPRSLGEVYILTCIYLGSGHWVLADLHTSWLAN